MKRAVVGAVMLLVAASGPGCSCGSVDSEADEPADEEQPGADAGPSDERPGSAVTGTMIETFVSESGTEDVPVNLSQADIAAIVEDPGGEFRELVGSGDAAGRFTVEGVPEGATYTLRYGSGAYVVTNLRELDLGFASYGRPGLHIQEETPVQFDLTGLAPWQPTDELDFFVPASGSNYFVPELGAGTPPEPGATEMQFEVDYAEANTPRPVEAGQATFLSQLSTRTDPETGLGYRAISRLFTSSDVSVEEGVEGAIAGELVEVPADDSAVFDWSGDAFAQAVPAVGRPIAAFGTIEIAVFPGDQSAHGPRGLAARLVDAQIGDQGQTISVSFGNPYPPSWPEYSQVRYQQDIELPFDGGSVFASFSFSHEQAGRFEGAIEPPLGPVQDPRINGLDATTNQSGVLFDPTLSWDAPAIGTADGYVVVVFRVLTGEENGIADVEQVAELRTTARELVLPPGILDPGELYMFQIRAVTRPTSDFARAPYRARLPASTAEFPTAIMAP